MHDYVRSIAVAIVVVTTAAGVDAQPLNAAADDDEAQPWARGVPAEQRDKARVLNGLGSYAFNEKDDAAQAIELYRQALALWDHPGIHLNLTAALVALNRPLEAYDSVQRALRFDAAPFTRQEYRRALDYQRELNAMTAEIEVVCAMSDARVLIDGEPIALTNDRVTRRVMAGPHQIVVSKPGFADALETVTLRGGERHRVGPALRRLHAITETRRRWKPWKPWAVVAGGLAVGAAGMALHWRSGVNATAYRTEIDRLCANSAGCIRRNLPDDVLALERRAALQDRLAVTATVVSAVGVLVGTGMLIANRTIATRHYESVVRVTPTLDPTNGSVGFDARFRF